ncbi:hypothetical protein FGO68_gene14708 [Halteria grandinella]|uniref:Uncharacterized protein n=1 Tax=Halteria grandinella TaxID=5974 RepID=A0A8J8N8W9_HALGN|nr:hypothetical protein FGO68_gene14708 [Halteria grandinella]
MGSTGVSLALSPLPTVGSAAHIGNGGCTRCIAYSVAYQVKAAGEVDAQLIVYDVNKAGLHIGEGPPQLYECAVDEALVLLLALRGAGYMHQKHLVVIMLLLKQGRVVKPVRDQGGLSATFISRNDQWLVLHLHLVLLWLGQGLVAISVQRWFWLLLLWLLLLLLLLLRCIRL